MAGKSDSDADKSEAPSNRRLSKAREEGSIARSRELAPSLMLLVGAAIIAWGGDRAFSLFERIVTTGLHIDPEIMRDPERLLPAAWSVIEPGLDLAIGFGVVMAVIATLASSMIGGVVLSWPVVTPDFSRLDPWRGIKRLFSRDALVETVKSVIKLAAVAAVVYWRLSGEAREFIDLARSSWPSGLLRMGGLVTDMFLTASVAVLVVAFLEAPYRLWSHRQELRMSREDLREEAKEVEGNPHTKRRLKMALRRMSRMRMMTQIPKADVVVMNPTHVSVALRYQEGSARPPKLVAKGVGKVALRIREIALAHGVPLVEAPPLARALNRYIEIDDEIPVPLYRAVAEVLAFVYRLRAARQAGAPDLPLPESALFEPPDELRV